MPVAGVDPGTLEDRYTDALTRGSVVAKTGTLISTDGGASFQALVTLGTGNTDQPTIVSGPGSAGAMSSVWITFNGPDSPAGGLIRRGTLPTTGPSGMPSIA